MTNRPQLKKIGILGHVGNGNLGDEAIFAAVIQHLRRRHPTAELYAFTSNPRDTQARHLIPAFPIRRWDGRVPWRAHSAPTSFDRSEARRGASRYGRIKRRLQRWPRLYAVLKRSLGGVRSAWDGLRGLGSWARAFKALKPLDLLIVAGSNQVFDYFGGCWGFPYTLFKWAMLAKVSWTKLVFLSVGAGPIQSSLSRFFLKRALALAGYRSFRDESSQRLIAALGLAGADPVCPDLAFGLYLAQAAPLSAGAGPIVGINPMPVFADYYWPEADGELYQSYLQKLAAFALWLIESGYTVLFFPTQLRADPPAIDKIKHLMLESGSDSVKRHIIDPPVSTLDDLVNLIASTDIVVATRFHGILISYILNKPVLGLSYHRKIDDMMHNLDQSKYILSIYDFDLASLIDKFRLLEADSSIVRARIRHKVAEYRDALARQYEHILSL
jgi:polysaccharide pyruvyl transferase WcaK-like protein